MFFQLLVAMVMVCLHTPASTNALNVLLVGVDDLRPQAAGIYGQNEMLTPNIDRLAAQGTTFLRAYCQVRTRLLPPY